LQDAKGSSETCRKDIVILNEKDFDLRRRESCPVVTKTKEGGIEG
jgi:hypothetical protein